MICIVPNKYITCNCIENSIINVCEAYSIDHRPIFLYSWDFGYHKIEETIGGRIHYQYFGEIGFEKYIGVAKKFLNISISESSNNTEKVIANAKNGITQLISTDSFDCPWNMAFHQYHYPHYYILSYEEDNHRLVIIDSFSSNDVICLNDEQLTTIKDVYCVEYFPSSETSLQILKKEFLHFVLLSNQRDIFKLIREFASDLLMVNSIEELSPQITDASNSYIVRRVSYIANSRANTANFMRYIEISEESIACIEDAYKRWESLKNLFIKILISKKLTLLEQAYDYINSIAQVEKKLSDTILSDERI